MKRILLLIILFVSVKGYSQVVQDSSSTVVQTDTSTKAPATKVIHHPRPKPVVSDSIYHTFRNTTPYLLHEPHFDDTFHLARNPYFNFTNPVHLSSEKRQWQGKEILFYSLVTLLIFFALIRNAFKKYFADLFRIFFRTTLQQKQIREQLLQSPLPSLLFNIFFVLSEGFFLALLVQHFQLETSMNFWLLLLYAMAAITVIYTVKFLSLKLMGWVFQLSEAMNTYIFIVFTSNKIIGICLLPFIILMAFSSGIVNQSSLTLSLMMLAGLFLYRYFLSYISVHRQIKISFFHFLIYLLAFEIAPLLLINKLLVTFLRETY